MWHRILISQYMNMCMCGCVCTWMYLDVSVCVFVSAASHIPLAEGLRGAGGTRPADVQFPVRVLRQVTGALAAWYQRRRDLEVT